MAEASNKFNTLALRMTEQSLTLSNLRAFVSWYTVRYFAIAALPVIERLYALWFRLFGWELTDCRKGEHLLQLLCGWNGHAGVAWYNVNGLEPDMHCLRCGEDLG